MSGEKERKEEVWNHVMRNGGVFFFEGVTGNSGVPWREVSLANRTCGERLVCLVLCAESAKGVW